MENNSTQIVTIKLSKSYTAVAITLIIICCIVGGYFITYAIKPPGYHVMYLLDNQNQAVNYPQTLVINQNNTFTAPIIVTNNMRVWQDYQIQVKIVHHTINFPIDASPYSTYEFTLNDAQSWDSQIPITISEEGVYSVVFELYAKNNDNYIFTDNFCILHLTVTTGTA
jgi:uncharacterized membrane protein